jgi:hypothetical protein
VKLTLRAGAAKFKVNEAGTLPVFTCVIRFWLVAGTTAAP